jgi:DNA-binding response OmpR family regulator
MSKKILVVDDDPPITKGIEMVLNNAGYTTAITLKGKKQLVSLILLSQISFCLMPCLPALMAEKLLRSSKPLQKLKTFPLFSFRLINTWKKILLRMALIHSFLSRFRVLIF